MVIQLTGCDAYFYDSLSLFIMTSYHIVPDTNGREKLVDMRNRVLTRSCYLISCSRVGLQGRCQEKAVVLVRLACFTVQ